MSEFKNLFITVILSTMILVGWQLFYENPRLKNVEKERIINQQQLEDNSSLLEEKIKNKFIDRKELIDSDRIYINSEKLKGSINLKGLRFDDLSLNNYKDKIDSENKVILLSPRSSKDSYFIEIGWISKDNIDIPDNNTIWNSNKSTLNSNNSIEFYWTNKDNMKFMVEIKLDDNYLFTVKQSIINDSNKSIEIASYGLINKLLSEPHKSYSVLHEGPIGVLDSKLIEKSYDKLKNNKKENFPVNNKGDWFGITDKYWLTAIFPDNSINFSSNFINDNKSGNNIYQVDYISNMHVVKPKENLNLNHHIFAGAKKLDILDNYQSKYNFKLFDRAVDFGWFYFITKPMFNALQILYKIFGNFGVAILTLTVIIKSIMFPLANKSYKSMNKMKKLQPELVKVKELCGDDRLKLNKEMMELYRKHNVNPLSGCLPVLIQIPVFFSLYKVLFVTIEMRQAPFFGWISDLSAPDPTTIFNLFGLINWNPPAILMIGVWPIIMGITMYLQQKMNPEPTDPVQAQVMKFLPVIFTFMFNSFPAGLVIYWAWNNLLSILQQWIINKESKI